MMAAHNRLRDCTRQRFSSSGHLDEDEIENYILNRLNEPQRIAVENHVIACSSCCQQLEDTEEFIADMKAAWLSLSAADQGAFPFATRRKSLRKAVA